MKTQEICKGAAVLSLLSIVLLSNTVHVHGQTDGGVAKKEYAALVVERLDLNEAQIEALRPVLEKAIKERQAILRKHGITKGSRPSIRQVRAAKPELEKAKLRTRADVSKILNADQMEEYDRVVAEIRTKAREEARRRR